MARSELERALALAREKFGPSHVTTLVSISRLAAFSSTTGDSARAVSLRADSTATVTKGLKEDR